MNIHTLPLTHMKFTDWLTAAGMYLLGALMISAFLAFMGVVARFATYFFCFGYGC